jgi:hypothetical protein
VRHPGTANEPKHTAKSLPCVDAQQRGHGSVANGNALFVVHRAVYARQRPLPCQASFAVRGACFAMPRNIAVRRQGCRACRLCRALRPFAERRSVAVGHIVAVRWALPCVGAYPLPCAPGIARTAKAVAAYVARSQNTTHGKGAVCRDARQRVLCRASSYAARQSSCHGSA